MVPDSDDQRLGPVWPVACGGSVRPVYRAAIRGAPATWPVRGRNRRRRSMRRRHDRLRAPGAAGQRGAFDSRYENFIGGEWVPPVKGQYFDQPHAGHRPDLHRGCPRHRRRRGTGARCRPRRGAGLGQDLSRRPGRCPAQDRGPLSSSNLETLAVAETWDNGKPVRETLAADLPLAVDHFRYFAAAIRAQEGSIGELDEQTVAYHFHEPLGVVGQIIPWNFPILMATWKLAAGPGRGQCRRAQARRADARVDPHGRRAHRGPGPGRRGQHRQWVRRRGWEASRLQPSRRQGRLHRRDHHRAADHAVRQPEHQAGDARARRQEPEHLPRGRRPLTGRVLRQDARRLRHVRAEPG